MLDFFLDRIWLDYLNVLLLIGYFNVFYDNFKYSVFILGGKVKSDW